jgi:hypothetical protein
MRIRYPFRWSMVLLCLSTVAGLLLAELSLRVAARLNPQIAYLATAGTRGGPPVFTTLHEYLASKVGHIMPHREWRHYWANALGLYDEEFSPGKAPGRLRVMALGDSFCFGLVPYPDNVLTVVERELHRACDTESIHVDNFCIPASGVWDYHVVYELAHDTFPPDLVVVHFYMGNDGPDVLHRRDEIPRARQARRHSYALRFLTNVLTVYRTVPGATFEPLAGVSAQRVAPHPDAPEGGKAYTSLPLTDRDPLLAGPTFTEQAFWDMVSGEVGRFYRGQQTPQALHRAWTPVLQTLDSLYQATRRNGHPLRIVLYPSALQVYPAVLAESVERLRGKKRFRELAVEDFDVREPNRVLSTFCHERQIPCLDLTETFLAAAHASHEPLYIGRDSHWNIRGNHLTGRHEAAWLQESVCALAQVGIGPTR